MKETDPENIQKNKTELVREVAYMEMRIYELIHMEIKSSKEANSMHIFEYIHLGMNFVLIFMLIAFYVFFLQSGQLSVITIIIFIMHIILAISISIISFLRIRTLMSSQKSLAIREKRLKDILETLRS